MNCKPGDLAIIVRAPVTRSAVGCIVRCIRLVTRDDRIGGYTWWTTESGPVWEVESQGAPILWGDELVKRRAFRDANLRPIRDPGADATDETLLWKTVPKEDAELLEALREWAREQV